MTRAIVRLLGDKEGVIRLYRSSNGGVCNGIGEDLLEFCKFYKGAISVGEVLKSLILVNQKLGSVYSARNGSTVQCENYLCKGHSLIGWCKDMRNAEDEWNKVCEKIEV